MKPELMLLSGEYFIHIFTNLFPSPPVILDWIVTEAARRDSWSTRVGCQIRATTAESLRGGETV